MAPTEELDAARERLGQLDRVPESASASVTALLGWIRRIELTDETEQQWRDLVASTEKLDPTDAGAFLALTQQLKEAPTTPPPHRGWLLADLAVLDCARAINTAFPETTPETESS
ncbi:hypothetical protein SAMN04487820_1094 [Actinopolyspora mzabensis]|uniref:Uncharacterized protein n=2 Tax=Actinopolyspora mzabensis TaxID=995066 RepID=A0A1G9CMY5_ACTMZ|nr:hypothetical protein SAMN04487820_1094 [Actinopolyspora mzabensis]